MAKTTTVSAATFKAQCLELMDRVRETRETYVITKHGKPVARLVACEVEPDKPFFGSMAGTVIEYPGALDPIPGEWFTDPFLNPPARRPARKPGRTPTARKR